MLIDSASIARIIEAIPYDEEFPDGNCDDCVQCRSFEGSAIIKRIISASTCRHAAHRDVAILIHLGFRIGQAWEKEIQAMKSE
jgi:hypothetical protein